MAGEPESRPLFAQITRSVVPAWDRRGRGQRALSHYRLIELRTSYTNYTARRRRFDADPRPAMAGRDSRGNPSPSAPAGRCFRVDGGQIFFPVRPGYMHAHFFPSCFRISAIVSIGGIAVERRRADWLDSIAIRWDFTCVNTPRQIARIIKYSSVRVFAYAATPVQPMILDVTRRSFPIGSRSFFPRLLRLANLSKLCEQTNIYNFFFV